LSVTRRLIIELGVIAILALALITAELTIWSPAQPMFIVFDVIMFSLFGYLSVRQDRRRGTPAR